MGTIHYQPMETSQKAHRARVNFYSKLNDNALYREARLISAHELQKVNGKKSRAAACRT